MGKSVPRQALADAIRDITNRLMSGERVDDSTTLHISLPNAPVDAAANAAIVTQGVELASMTTDIT